MQMRVGRSVSLTTALFTIAISLGACGTMSNPLDFLDPGLIIKTAGKPADLSTPVQPASLSMPADYVQQIDDLSTDNLQLKKELADALNETAKLKRQLKAAMQDNSLLRDLAARKMR